MNDNSNSNDLSIAHDRLNDESEGAGRYQSMAGQAKDESLKALLTSLAAEELEHGKKLTAWIEAHPAEPEEAQKSAVAGEIKSLTVEICKVADNIIYGIVLKPGIEDLQGDIMGAEDIQKACHEYMQDYRTINIEHAKDVQAFPVECWIAKEAGKLGNRPYPPGAWLMGTKIDDPVVLADVRSGIYKSYSIEGEGHREPITV